MDFPLDDQEREQLTNITGLRNRGRIASYI